MAYLHRAYFNSTASIDVFDATHDIKRALRDSKLDHGLITVYVPGSSAGVVILENAPEIREAFKELIASIVDAPKGERPQRRSGTGAVEAHLRAVFLGRSVTIPVHQGCLLMSPWQEVIVFDFDNKPARTEIIVHVLAEPKPQEGKR